MAPPRKYVVNTQGDIVGVAKPEKKADVTDADTMKLKEQVEKKIESAKKAEVMKKEEEGLRAEDLMSPMRLQMLLRHTSKLLKPPT